MSKREHIDVDRGVITLEYLLRMENVSKNFPGVKALDNVSLKVQKGEIHALLGENGAGKSTLMKILGGIHKPEEGNIYFNGNKINEINPDISKKLGIGFVHQELNLSEDLNVAENIFMGRLPEKSFGVIDYKKLHEETTSVLKELDATFNSKTMVSKLTTANKQLVEIAKAISLDVQVIIFDEPTTSLSDKDVSNLFAIIKRLKKNGVSSIYISHRMKEIFELCETATILRDGTYIDTVNLDDVDMNQIIKMIVGRELSDFYPKTETEILGKSLEVETLNDKHGNVKNISFYARKGEVLGFSGLVGAGRTELVRLLFGADHYQSGTIKIDGSIVQINSPVKAIKNGICLLTEDRKHQGLALGLSVLDNINLPHLESFVLNQSKMKGVAQKYKESLNIKVHDIKQKVSSLSGGNQQKVVLGKWLNKDASIFIFDEPTKGIDVGAKTEIYEIINDLSKKGKTIIVISSEIPELLGITDRIYVMCEGRITGELMKEEATPENIMKLSTLGGSSDA